ncbi:MAG: hypothetical protein IT288_02425 [Bdellovibrionales bacterium]|nr:hypothetical protein [Bdellovibrionales bacterium]
MMKRETSPSVYSLTALVIFFVLLLMSIQAKAQEAYPTKEIPGCKGLPWELLSKDCETLLPDIHYADAIQNRQIADTRMIAPDRQRYYQIDRLIYPTIGAPNLFFSGLTEGKGANVNDELVVMLNLPDPEYADLLSDDGKALSPKSARKLPFKPQVTTKGSESGIFVYLTLRTPEIRASLFQKKSFGGVTKPNAFYALQPVGVWRYARPDEMPRPLAERAKLKLVFGQQEMRDVPPGFYDIRMEVMNGGKLVASEFQYNAVRVFDRNYDQSNYEVLNVTDSQASVGVLPLLLGKSFRQQTLDRLTQMVHHMRNLYQLGRARNEAEEKVLKAAFITFNGDLHNGGDPLILKPEDVAKNYNEEAIAILDVLKELPVPIFLTIGKHDGYVSMGHAPGFISDGPARIAKIAQDNVRSGAIDQATVNEFSRFLKDTAELPGGNPVDIFDGHYVRRANQQRYDTAWTEPTAGTKRNIPLYDGFNQWKRAYGPLTQSWSFGKTTYVNINSFDLRQHMRSGWGMYTVNYGGNVSSHQMIWIHREINRLHNGQKFETVLLAHHDPRGGHKNVGYPFYFRQVPFKGMDESFKNYVSGEIIQPKICEHAPEWVKKKSTDLYLGCLQDGLQEWMRPDPQFDCGGLGVIADGPNKGQCDVEKMRKDPNIHPDYSGYKLIHELATNRNVRTMILGHTHYNSLEVLQPGDRLVPDQFILDPQTHESYAMSRSFFDAVNPVRLFSRWMGKDKKEREAKMQDMSIRGIVEETLKDVKVLSLVLELAGHSFERVVQDHELVIMRFTSVAKLTEQEVITDLNAVNYGFQVLSVDDAFVYKDHERRSMINGVTFLRNSEDGDFLPVNKGQMVSIDRSQRLSSVDKQNPFEIIFDSTKSRPHVDPIAKLRQGN